MLRCDALSSILHHSLILFELPRSFIPLGIAPDHQFESQSDSGVLFDV